MSFCINCGTQLADGSKFCINCGTAQPAAEPVQAPVCEAPVYETPVEPAPAPVYEATVEPAPAPVYEAPVEPAPAPVYEAPVTPAPAPVYNPNMAQPQAPVMGQPGQPKKKKNLGLIIGVAAAAFVALITIITVVIVLILSQKTEIDLSKYVKIKVEGYDTVGELTEFNFDKAQLLKDIMKAKGEKNVDKLKRGDVPDEIYYLVDSIYMERVDLDEKYVYANGDTIELKISYDEEYLEKAKIKFKNEDYTFTVKGLTELIDFDIFENITMTFTGMDGDGYASYEKTSNEEIYNNVYFDYDNRYDLSNGDTVTLYVYTYSGDDTGSYYGYRFASTSKTYTVEGLEKQVSDLSDLSDKNMNAIEDIAKDAIAEEYEDKDAGKLSNLTYVGSYFAKHRTYASNNMMFAIFTATLAAENGEFEPTDVYIAVELYDLVLDGNGELKRDDIDVYLIGGLWMDGYYGDYYEAYDDAYRMHTKIVDDYCYGYDVITTPELPDYSQQLDETPATDEAPATDEEDDWDGSLGMGGDEEDAA